MINNMLGEYSKFIQIQDGRIISEKDPDFDVNKWIKLALGTIKK